MNALIILNGLLPDRERLSLIATSFDYLIAADGAVKYIEDSIALNAICGDFDSITQREAKAKFPDADLIVVEDQNNSDLEKSVNHALIQHVESITLIGAFGGRIDHSLVSLSIAIQYNKTVYFQIIENNNLLYILSPECKRKGLLSFKSTADQTLSLISLVPSSVVSITGVQWPLNNHQLLAGSQGVSNKSLAGEVHVSITQGCVAFTKPYDPVFLK